MKRKPIDQLSMEDLLKQKKFLTGVTIAAGIFLCFLAVIVIYMMYHNRKVPMALLLICWAGSILPGFYGLGKVNKEIKKRKDQQQTNHKAGTEPAG